MTDSELKAGLVDRSVLALTAWAEAAGDWREGLSSVEERIAVMCVARNRLADFRSFGAVEPTYRSVCLAPKQFSCWFPGGGVANYARLLAMAERLMSGSPLKDALMYETLFLADGIMAGLICDRTQGATAYYAPQAMKPVGRVPAWAAGKPTLRVGAQLFICL